MKTKSEYYAQLVKAEKCFEAGERLAAFETLRQIDVSMIQAIDELKKQARLKC